ncbi:MAG: hypothetical protein WDA09_11730, partial [Bacteriovoracaceae bacterium]
QNWVLAEKAISTRLHLFIPKETKPTLPGPDETGFIGPVMPERVPAPGDPDFIGPVLSPAPGEPEFIGPVLPPGPGEEGFIGPVLSESTGTSTESASEAGEPEVESSSGEEVEDEESESPTPSTEEIRLRRFLIQIGAQSASANKTVENTVRQEITDREAIVDKDGKPLDLGNKILTRAWNVLKYRFSRRGFKQGINGLMREKTRYQLGQEDMQKLQQANLGGEISGNAARHLKELQEDGKQMLSRTRSYVETGEAPIEGEEVSGIIEGPFRSFVTDTLLYGDNGVLAKIRLGADEATIQAEIQQKMFEYVSAHQDDDTITHFFGQNNNRYGEISKFYATDLLETAKAIAEQARVQAVAAEMLKDQIDIRLVRAQQEKASEIDYTTFEKLMVLSKKNRVASWVLTPTSAGVIAALATAGTKSAVRRTAMISAGAVLSPWAVPVAGIAVGVVFAVGRERQRYKADTLDVARDSAEGKFAPEKAVYRKKIENVVHPLMVDINILRNGDRAGESGDKLTGERRRSIDELLELPLHYTDATPLEERLQIEKNRQEVASRYGEIRARLSAPAVAPHSSVFAEIDRVQYTAGQKPEAGRTLLVQDLISLRQAATRGLSGEALDEMNEFLNSKTAEWSTQLMTDKETQEHKFKRARLKRALGQGAKMGISAGLGGLAGQEALAVAARYVPGADILPGFNRGQTRIEKALGINETHSKSSTHTEYKTELVRDETVPDIEKFQKLSTKGTGSMELSDRYNLIYDEDQGITIFDTQTKSDVYEFDGATIDNTGKIHITGDVPTDVQKIISPEVPADLSDADRAEFAKRIFDINSTGEEQVGTTTIIEKTDFNDPDSFKEI